MRSRALLTAVVAVVVAAATPVAAVPPPPSPLAALDAEVERARREFEIPGLALAVVKDGRVLLAKGYGARRLGASDPVDAGTLFAIASNTKAFTAAALGLLVEDGTLAWDDPVSRHLPAFQMYDPYVSLEMTIRDLLTHRSGLGLGEGDLLYFPPSTFTRREIVERVRFLKPASSFRSRYAHDNILYIVAGEVVAAVGGRSWETWYGEAAIALEGDHLVLRFSRSPSLTGDLEHWQYDTFAARRRDRTVPDAFVGFALRPDGSIEQFKMAAISPAADFSYDYQDLLFTPVPEK